ncbi:MAG: hypothetical protein J0H39_10765 [Alphaproteobacteria bacterium]|nr:hypothetical protein [Alphaproteobacteria bacterium]
MSPLLTFRRFENAAHGALPRPLDTVALVVAGAIVLAMQLSGAPGGKAVDAAVIPGIVVAFAIAARVGREASNRRRGESRFGIRFFALCRTLYLVCALLATVAALVTVICGLY